jgi:DME family drug/metabolite transporter
LLSIMLAAFSWGTVGVTTQALYRTSAATPLSVGLFRLALAVPALALAGWARLGTQLFRLSARDGALVATIGAMSALYQVCYFQAIPRVGVAVATLVTLCAAPVIVALFSAVFLSERPTPKVVAALLLAVGGTALLVGGGSAAGTTSTGSSVAGTALALAAAGGYAVVTLCSRSLSTRCHPFQTLAFGFALGAALLLAATLPTGPVLRFPARGWALLTYLGLVPTALAYALFISGLRDVPATVATVATLLEPFTSAVLAWFLLGERLGRLGILGAILLGSAMLMLLARPATRAADG